MPNKETRAWSLNSDKGGLKKIYVSLQNVTLKRDVVDRY